MTKRHSCARGFTLLEALVVVALLGLATLFVSSLFGSTYTRWQLDSSATEIRAFLESTYDHMVTTHGETFVHLNGQWLTVSRDAAGTNVLDSYRIPAGLELSTNWPDDGTGAQALGCDSMGRTMNVGTGAMVNAVQQLSVDDRDMLDGRVQPRITYQIQIYPLWRVDVQKQIR
jgi:prepilin-type N-terminal cleavage/methylation domain-containing protein